MVEFLPDLVGIVLGIGMLGLMFRIGSQIGKLSGKLEIVCKSVASHEARLQHMEGIIRHGRQRPEDRKTLEQGS